MPELWLAGRCTLYRTTDNLPSVQRKPGYRISLSGTSRKPFPLSCMRSRGTRGLTMPRQKKAPEMNFQQHIADFLIHEHKYGVLEQGDITDTEHFIAEDQLGLSSRPRKVTRLSSLRTTTERMRGTRYSSRCARNWSTRRCGCSSVTGYRCVA